MIYQVLITRAAAYDIDQLAKYLLEETGEVVASKIIGEIDSLINSLITFPERGANPQDIAGISHISRKQLVYSHFRVIYQIVGDCVYIEMVVDSRRNVKTLFEQRLQSDF